jgi:hypothetical protein
MFAVARGTHESRPHIPQSTDNGRYTALGHKLRFFKGGKAQFVTVGIIFSFSNFKNSLKSGGSRIVAIDDLSHGFHCIQAFVRRFTFSLPLRFAPRQ